MAEKDAKQYEMEDYVLIIPVVMMQESKGISMDPMQAFEHPYHT